VKGVRYDPAGQETIYQNINMFTAALDN
jgi:hypothetical protein